LRYFIDGLRILNGDEPIIGNWKLFEKYITNVELIAYHSRRITITSKLTNIQFDYLVGRFEESINFIINFDPKLFIFNGSPLVFAIYKEQTNF
jgi:hypothetical protein